MAFKFVCAFALVCASVNAGLLPATYQVGPVGIIGTDGEVDPHPSYSFAYDVNDPVTGDSKSHSETRNGDVVHGSYSLNDPDGTRRTVDYTADDVHGFNAVVRKEPNGLVAAAPLAYAAAPAHVVAAPAPVAYAAPAPVSYAAPAPAIVRAHQPLAYAAPAHLGYAAPAHLGYAAPAAGYAYSAPAPYAVKRISYAAAPLGYAAPAPLAYAAPSVYSPYLSAPHLYKK